MKLYLAGANSQGDIHLFEKIGCLYMLQTFYDMKKMKEELAEQCLSFPKEFILDSGAFTFMNGGKAVDWKQYVNEYIAFINRYDIKQFIELDLYGILGVEKVERIRHRIEEKTGKKPIPVYHGTMPVSYYRMLCEQYPYVAISATGSIESSVWTRNKRMLKQIVKIGHSYGTKLHGLGYTRLDNLNTKEVPFDSVDSTSWLAGCKFARIYTLNGGRLWYKDVKGINATRKELAEKNLKVWVEKQKQLDCDEQSK